MPHVASHEVDVLTNVTLESGGLVFEHKKLWVLAEELLDPIVIPVDPCPPPEPDPEPPPEPDPDPPPEYP